MPPLPILKARELITALQKAGAELSRDEFLNLL
jgi:predicted RNA binding protein YcfA (HicA-like mRNA interferase family)